MAAINIHIETQDPADLDHGCAVGAAGGGTLGAPRRCAPPLETSHTGLTRLVWIRRSLEDLMAQRRYRVVGSWIEIDPPMPQFALPWLPSPRDMQRFALFGEAAKMACPTWDLPAGALAIGGTCPGAQAGQSVVPVQIRRKAEGAIKASADLSRAICQLCYATGGNYAVSSTQLAEIVRFAWARDTLARAPEEFVSTMVAAIGELRWRGERQIDPRTGRPVMPIRVHSSGDFFSHRYAEAWIEIANRTPQIMYWAPTRTWAYPGWIEVWRQLIPRLRHGNLALRPSAYHTDDPAPSPRDLPWAGAAEYPFPAMGTTAIYKGTNQGEGRDPRFDWNCRTYAIFDSAKSCKNAIAPDGQVGCRACWIKPDLRVNYTVH